MPTIRPLAVVSATIAAVVATGAVGAPELARAGSEEPPRFSLSAAVLDCADAPVLSLAYDDHVDGHRPVAVQERVVADNSEIWSRSELHHVAGDYRNTAQFEVPPDASLRYEVTITYDDGATRARSVEPTVEGCADGVEPLPDAQRFDVKVADYHCLANGTGAVEFAIYDAADGRTISAIELSLADHRGGVFPIPSEYFPLDDATEGGLVGLLALPQIGFAPGELRAEPYTLTVTATYDSERETHDRTIDLGATCRMSAAAGSQSSSTSPSSQTPGTLPLTR